MWSPQCGVRPRRHCSVPNTSTVTPRGCDTAPLGGAPAGPPPTGQLCAGLLCAALGDGFVSQLSQAHLVSHLWWKGRV